MDPFTSMFFMRLLVAMLCGVILGLERVFANKTAGMRTYALVSMGAALFVIVGQYVSLLYGDTGAIDPVHMAAQVVSGIGFLGAGLIIMRRDHVTGITTATSIWVAAGIGVAAGFGFFKLAIFATIFTLFVLTVLWFIESFFRKHPLYPENGHSLDKEE